MTYPPQQPDQRPYDQRQPTSYQGLLEPGRPWPGAQPGKPRTGLLAGIVIAVVLVAAGGVTLAAVFGGEGFHPNALPAGTTDAAVPSADNDRPGAAQPVFPADVRAVRELAKRFAAALSSDTAEALTAISCSTPSAEQLAAFNSEAVKSDFTFTLIGAPHIDGDVATGKMQGRLEVLSYTLHKRDSGWCASFEWSALLN